MDFDKIMENNLLLLEVFLEVTRRQLSINLYQMSDVHFYREQIPHTFRF